LRQENEVPPSEWAVYVLGLSVVGAPIALLCVLGFFSLIEWRLSERATNRLVIAAVLTGFLSSAGMLAIFIHSGVWHFPLGLQDWLRIDGYHFSIALLFDALSLPFVLLAFVLCSVIGAFASRYLHREPGYSRFFVLYALFVAGMALTAVAGTIEVLFAGWELVGLSSAFLVAFFQERPMPVRNGLRVWTVYRVSDAAFLLAAIVLHRMTGRGDFDAVLGSGPWPSGHAVLSESQARIVGLLLIVAAAGKSALVPFSGWLPRAMEGPTPSSAVFYGAISVHLGAFLLLRVSPLLEVSALLCGVVVALGLVTAAYATLAGRVQTDIKTALSFASLTQVGLIVAEIGLGFRYLALAHLIGHACLRTLQFLRAPTLLHDYHTLENAIGHHLPRTSGFWRSPIPEAVHVWCYRFALERGYLDAWLTDYLVRPFLGLFQWCDRAEHRWTRFLSGGRSDELDRHKTPAGSLDELT
jgi:NAD(P)H-quinone oxidoreductase subunit 5